MSVEGAIKEFVQILSDIETIKENGSFKIKDSAFLSELVGGEMDEDTNFVSTDAMLEIKDRVISLKKLFTEKIQPHVSSLGESMREDFIRAANMAEGWAFLFSAKPQEYVLFFDMKRELH